MMNIRSLVLVSLALSITACAIEPANETVSTTDQAVTANEVDKTYYSNNTFTTEVGGNQLTCGRSNLKWGVWSRYVVESQYPCNGGGERMTCLIYTADTSGSSYDVVECPAYLF